MEYVKKFPKEVSFETKDFFKGYQLSSKLGIEVDYIDMINGHEFYQKEAESVHIYYILEGSGIASINEKMYKLESGDTVEIPINTEFAFKGKMKMIEIMNPPFNPETHLDTKKNDLNF
ncbi:MAG: hypothetical protein HFJ44_03545 [Clostridia bacterium]|jgi:mannose-6-phosphate isomerase-like protein (cupin superfamily)|nr:hypothetical protein [Clostridia bacterium]